MSKEYCTVIANYYEEQSKEHIDAPRAADVVKILFANLPDLHKLSEQTLLSFSNLYPEKSSSSDLSLSSLAAAWDSLLDQYSIYGKYLTNYTKAAEWLSKEAEGNANFAALLNAVRERTRSVDLKAQLISPVQRLPRYRLLLREIIRHSHPEQPGYSDLKQIYSKVKQLLEKLDEEVKLCENEEKLVELDKNIIIPATFSFTFKEKDRLFVKEGVLTCMGNKKRKERFVVLLSDVLVLCEVNKTLLISSEAPLYVLKHALPLAGTKLLETPPDQPEDFVLRILGPHKSFSLFLSSAEEQLSWCSALKKTITHFNHYNIEVPLVALWKPNSEVCMICSTAFSMLRRRHHCRKCGQCVCRACASHFAVFSLTSKPKRVCVTCLPSFHSSDIVSQKSHFFATPSLTTNPIYTAQSPSSSLSSNTVIKSLVSLTMRLSPQSPRKKEETTKPPENQNGDKDKVRYYSSPIKVRETRNYLPERSKSATRTPLSVKPRSSSFSLFTSSPLSSFSSSSSSSLCSSSISSSEPFSKPASSPTFSMTTAMVSIILD